MFKYYVTNLFVQVVQISLHKNKMEFYWCRKEIKLTEKDIQELHKLIDSIQSASNHDVVLIANNEKTSKYV